MATKTFNLPDLGTTLTNIIKKKWTPITIGEKIQLSSTHQNIINIIGYAVSNNDDDCAVNLRVYTNSPLTTVTIIGNGVASSIFNLQYSIDSNFNFAIDTILVNWEDGNILEYKLYYSLEPWDN